MPIAQRLTRPLVLASALLGFGLASMAAATPAKADPWDHGYYGDDDGWHHHWHPRWYPPPPVYYAPPPPPVYYEPPPPPVVYYAPPPVIGFGITVR